MTQKITTILLIIAIAVIGAGIYLFHFDPLNPTHEGRVRVGETERRFIFYIPRHVLPKPGLIFVLHASDMKATTMQLVTGHEFDRLADKFRDFIVVYPQGYQKFWNDCRKAADYEAKLRNIDDNGFFESMIEWFESTHGIDRTRVFATGLSNGGQMCFKLARMKPNLLRGIASVSASQPVTLNDDCVDTAKPISVLIMNGTGDPINPFNGGNVDANDGHRRGAVFSTEATLQIWLDRNHCDLNANRLDFPDRTGENHQSTVIQTTYSCPKTRTVVRLITIQSGGHVYPNPGFSFWPKMLGQVSKDINAPEVVVNFFRSL